MNDNGSHTTLRDLPVAARVTLAVFLLSVGAGYTSAIIQLHFQDASGGKLLPTGEDAKRKFHGSPHGMSEFERLITAPETLPFNRSGTMRPAFSVNSASWRGAIRKLRNARNPGRVERKEPELDEAAAIKILRQQREKEIEAVLAWIHAGAPRPEFNNGYELPSDFVKKGDEEPDKKYFTEANGKWTAQVNLIIEDRCARCHCEDAGSKARHYPLTNYDEIKDYLDPEQGSGMSLTALAQTTHVHLLGFSMLYGLTGLIFAFSSYRLGIKLILCPLPLVAQVIDISFWWLGRVDPLFAKLVPISGGIVAMGLMLQIGLCLWDLSSKSGLVILTVLGLAAAGGGYIVWDKYMAPQMEREKAKTTEASGKT